MQTTINRLLFVILLPLSLLEHIACRPSKGSFSQNYPTDIEQSNEVRLQKGIRPIHPEWFFYGRQFGAEDWTDSKEDRYSTKRVQHDESGNHIWEEDHFYSGRSFETVDGTSSEEIVIHYDYVKDIFLIYYIGTNAEYQATFLRLETAISNHVEVDSVVDPILNSWGFENHE